VGQYLFALRVKIRQQGTPRVLELAGRLGTTHEFVCFQASTPTDAKYNEQCRNRGSET